MTPITLKLYKINNHLSFEYRVGTDKVVAVDEGEKVIFLLCNDESVKLYNPNYTL